MKSFVSKNYTPINTENIPSSSVSEGKLAYGRLLIEETNGDIYTYDIYSIKHQVGNSIRYLSEFDDIQSIETEYGILRFTYDKDGVLRLGLSLPRISISNLNNVYIDWGNTTDSYLGFSEIDNEIKLTNLNNLVFNIQDLSDVSNYIVSKRVDNWVLCSISYTGKLLRRNTSDYKDELGETIYYNWVLQPEASAIKDFDDAGRTTEANNQIYRIPKPSERKSYKYINAALDISYDESPELSNTLNANQKSITNLQYNTQHLIINNEIATLTLNIAEYTTTILTCNNVRLLELTFDIPITNEHSFYTHALIIEGYNGTLVVTNKHNIENGKAPIFTGDTVLLSIIAVNHIEPYITLYQKTLGAR